ncbi:MAG: DMT family transporter [Clostridia bacterium]|nr:DMT family transporter [Clostridia bacterium]
MEQTVRKDGFFSKTAVVMLGALICSGLWGSAFPCIKVGYALFGIGAGEAMTQILFAGLRFVLAGVMAIVAGSCMRKRLLIPRGRTWGRAAVLSMLQTVGQYVLFYIGLAHTTGVKASIVQGANVFVAIAVASLVFRKERLTARKMVGSLVGFAGVVLVNLAGNGSGLRFNFGGDGLVLLSTVCYACSSAVMKDYAKEDDPLLLSGWQFLIGGVVMTVFGLAFGGRLTTAQPGAVWMLLFLAFVSAAAYSLWSTLLKYNPVSRVAVYGFLTPTFGVVLSALLLKESAALGWAAAGSLVLIAIGIFIVNTGAKKAAA